VVWQTASVLLGYPDAALLARLPLLRTAVECLSGATGDPLRRFVAHAEHETEFDLASHYVTTFDHRRKCCLYLTYFEHGDTRQRGAALLDFKSTYRFAGLELNSAELPDHLAVALEFAATVDPDVGRELLVRHRVGIELLRLALADAESPYVDVLHAVSATLPQLAGNARDAVARLAAEGPPTEQVGLQPFPPGREAFMDGARR
jgi:nitrate reductase delta subunit